MDPVDVALCLAMDVSASVDFDEFALMAGAEAIRDVIAFPKTQRGQDLLTGAPTQVTEKQLRELHIRLRNPPPS